MSAIELCNYLGYAAAAASDSEQKGLGGGQFQQMMLMFGVIAIVFWLVILRPQKREQAKRQEVLDGVKKGDKVITIGGIHGWVTDVDKAGQIVTVRVDTKTEMKFNRSAISTIGAKDLENEKK